jgi:trans-aconitate methyltransferase
MEEKKRLKGIEDWYKDKQLDFDRELISYRYLSIKEYFKGPSCLELGPADGVQTQYLVNDFEHLTIVDGSKTLLDSIPNTSNLSKVHSLFEDYEPNAKFNTIILEHILEHVEKPVELLTTVKKWLSTEGVMIIGVPNGHSLHRLIGVEMGLLEEPCQLNDRDIALGHRRVYTMDSLKKDIIDSGHKIINTGGVFLKPLSNGQIEKHWDEELIEAFYKIGQQFPNNTAEIYCVCAI